MLNRSVKKIYPADENIKNNEGLTFSDILHVPNIVLLGEPGAGKTHLFKVANQHENGNYITARSFACNADNSYTEMPVYIDALDEKRSRGEHPDSIGEIIRLTRQIKPSKVRLSCRAADWLGETDLELFKPYFEANGGYCVVVLEALIETEIDRILSENQIDNPREFRDQAYNKGVSSLLNNPQTLIMLARSVNNGRWPRTKKDLYENATSLLLTEHNNNHQHKPLAAYTVNELKKAAGAACAVLLIADIEGISLLKSGNNPYAEIPYPNSDTILAALTKRAFVTLDQQEQVTYSHRTIAEYLAACWLVNTIRNGLPISRVCSLLCVDNHPAPELRGLYAWLTQLLPEHTNALLAADPYGVLVQGDVSCLSLSSRKALLNALVNLAHKDPWFRGQDWTSEPLGALSTPEMADEFKILLAKQPPQFHLRSIVLDAISHGESQPIFKDELLHIFCDNTANYAERSSAFSGLIHAVPNGKELVVKAVRERLQTSNDDLRLKEEVMADMFEGYFNLNDVLQLISEYGHRKKDGMVGGLWSLGHKLPLDVLSELLDRISQIKLYNDSIYRKIEHFNYEILKRVLFSGKSIDVEKLWFWVSNIKYDSSYYRGDDAIKDWFAANQNCVADLLKIALSKQSDLENIGGFWHDFQQLTKFTLTIEQLIDSAFSLIAEKDFCDAKDQFIFKLVFHLTICYTTDFEKFTLLFNYGNSHPELAKIVPLFCHSNVPDWRLKHANDAIRRKKKQETTQLKNCADFEKQKNLIRTGQHLGWLGVLAKHYLPDFSDVDRQQTPEKRLSHRLGEQNAADALEGLRAILNRSDLPTPLEIANLYGENKYYPDLWWYAVLAGMTENWFYQSDLNSYPENALKAALALNLLFPRFYHFEGNRCSQIEPDWQKALFQYKPELVQTVYLEVIETLLKTKRDYVQGIREICQYPRLTINRPAIVLRLLTHYSNTPIQELETLLLTALTLPEIASELLLLIEKTLQPHTRVRLKQKDLWLCAGFVMDFEQFKDTVTWCVAKKNDFVWTLMSFIGAAHSSSDKKQPDHFRAAQLGFLVRLVGKRFPHVEHPRNGWSGSHNPWDAADFVKRHINLLSTQMDKESVSQLNSLIDEPELDSYRDHIKHAAANQAALRREQHFDRPNWQQTIDSLKNGKPAHIADLHALTIEHLNDVANRIRTENTDIFKSFWNEDSYGKITEEPKPEESCRDRLIDLLRPKFRFLGISVEPENHMALDKRADIVLKYLTDQTLPIEVKRDYHDDLWAACENQLDRLYTRDPQAQGYGIYLVFWFGSQRRRLMPKPPSPLQKPTTAQELEDALRSLIKAENQSRLAVVVLDVTRPDG